MITEFGKALRKLRIDKNEVLKDMADKLQMTSSYLSAIECGKRNIPSNFIPRIVDLYHLNEEEVHILQEARDNCIDSIEIKLSGNGCQKRDLALQFARKFDGLDNETAKTILNFLKKQGD